MEIVWKEIPGYEGVYEASNTGLIRTVEGKTTWSSRFNGWRTWQQRTLKPKIYQPKGRTRRDERVTLYKGGEGKDYLVARLIASAFLGLQEEMTVITRTETP